MDDGTCPAEEVPGDGLTGGDVLLLVSVPLLVAGLPLYGTG